ASRAMLFPERPLLRDIAFCGVPDLARSGRSLDPHNAQSGIEVYVDVQDQAVRPSGECAKVRHGFCRYSYAAFNLNSHVVAVAEKKLSHILNCVGWVPHVS
ncbi:MAG TPA: hypothetical protein VF760_09050, partial [Xanthobacteraceae bacterium]